MDSQPLDFEKPILELQRRLQELKSHSDQHDIDFDSEVESMELKIRETRRPARGWYTPAPWPSHTWIRGGGPFRMCVSVSRIVCAPSYV